MAEQIPVLRPTYMRLAHLILGVQIALMPLLVSNNHGRVVIMRVLSWLSVLLSLVATLCLDKITANTSKVRFLLPWWRDKSIV